jgi:hypothetical protein
VRPAAGLLFLVFPVAIMDMLSGVFMCHWEHVEGPVSLLWPDVGECVASCARHPTFLDNACCGSELSVHAMLQGHSSGQAVSAAAEPQHVAQLRTAWLEMHREPHTAT